MPQHGLSVTGNLLAQPEVGAGMDIDQYALEGAAALLERASAQVLAGLIGRNAVEENSTRLCFDEFGS
jgi:hypothetical protein